MVNISPIPIFVFAYDLGPFKSPLTLGRFKYLPTPELYNFALIITTRSVILNR